MSSTQTDVLVRQNGPSAPESRDPGHHPLGPWTGLSGALGEPQAVTLPVIDPSTRVENHDQHLLPVHSGAAEVMLAVVQAARVLVLGRTRFLSRVELGVPLDPPPLYGQLEWAAGKLRGVIDDEAIIRGDAMALERILKASLEAVEGVDMERGALDMVPPFPSALSSNLKASHDLVMGWVNREAGRTKVDGDRD